jgi:metallo-beta-lactamase family protein
MDIGIFGAAKTVTGSCYGINLRKKRILVDCGMFQGSKKLNKLNYEKFPFDAKSYSALLLTHAHLDHCGRIPKLVKEGFNGDIYCTNATKDIAKIVLLDSAKVNKHDTELENKRRRRLGLEPREPIYTEDDVKNSLSLFKTVNYEKTIDLGSGIKTTFYDAGHILGSAIIELRIKENKKEKTVVFSGDLGQNGDPIIKDVTHLNKADYVFIESTYGDRLHSSVEKRKQELLNIILETYERRGKILIPSFAVERTQEILYDLNELVEKNLMPRIKIYVDTPMGIRVTNVFKKHYALYNKKIKDLIKSGDNPFSFPGLEFTEKVYDSMKLNHLNKPCIIIAGSGMCTGGRIKHHIKHNIWNPRNTMLFIGYQAEGTLGYHIKRGEKLIRLLGTRVAVKARIESIDSFSAHADCRGLLTWLKFFNPKPKKVFIVHGEQISMQNLEKKVNKLGLKTRIPEMNEKITI